MPRTRSIDCSRPEFEAACDLDVHSQKLLLFNRIPLWEAISGTNSIMKMKKIRYFETDMNARSSADDSKQ